MNTALINWLKVQFTAIQDVKIATTQLDSGVVFRPHKADLVVHTWMGGKLYLYLVNAPMKVRDIRGILRENSRCTIGTLFLVNAALLPRHGSQTTMRDWQESLQALNSGFIYALDVVDDGLQIIQVHFATTLKQDVYRVWHLTEFSIESAAIRRRSVFGNIRGEWFVGDVASPQYKRRINSERMNEQFHYRTKSTTPLSVAPVDQLREYYDFLGVEHGASYQVVKAAFRRMALKLHPDVSDYPKEEAENRFKELKEVYEFIKDARQWT